MAMNKIEGSSVCQSSSSSTKTERKIIEKNRRNQMKTLYSNLISLIPNHNPKEAMPLPDRLGEATNYIKSLQVNLERARGKKESLMGRKRLYTCTTTTTTTTNKNNMKNLKSPQMDIRVKGSTLEVVLTSGLHDQHIFYNVIRILHEERTEILNSSISINGNSIFLVAHAEIVESLSSPGAARVTERLNKLVYGSGISTSSEDDLQPELWDLDIFPELLDF